MLVLAHSPRSFLRRRRAVVVSLLALLIVGWWWHHHPPQADQVRSAAADESSSAVSAGRTSPPLPPALPSDQFSSSSDAPIIDNVTVEKSEVCQGEENLITVEAHSPDDDDRFLQIHVGLETGNRVPLRSWVPQDGTKMHDTIVVFGKDRSYTRIPVPAYKVKSCTPVYLMKIISGLSPNTVGEYDLEIRIINSRAPEGAAAHPFQAIQYSWDFGDGQTEQTNVPHVAHDYGHRSMNTLYSSFLVTVEAVDKTGEKLRARTSLSVINSTFENLAYRGLVTLLAEGVPHTPEINGDGIVSQGFQIWHGHATTVHLDRVLERRYRKSASEIPSPTEQSPGSLLGRSDIPPGPGIEVRLHYDTKPDPDIYMVQYELQGVTEDGLPVEGLIALMRPPDRPTRENSKLVNDPVLLAKIKLARQLLNQEFVTDGDLFRLEREGKFANLEVERPAASASASASRPNSSQPMWHTPPTAR